MTSAAPGAAPGAWHRAAAMPPHGGGSIIFTSSIVDSGVARADGGGAAVE